MIKPSAADQKAQLEAKFRSIADSFQHIQATVQGIEPEQVIVLETIGETVDGLAQAAAKVPGLEWLAELDLEDAEPVGGFQDAKDPLKNLSCRLYAVMSNQQAMIQLLTLWNDWTANPNKRAAKGFGPFKDVFINLKDIRRWSPHDRLQYTGVLDYWQENLQHEQKPIKFEVELWCRGEVQARQRAYANLASLIRQAGGQCIRQAEISEICYHGVLAEMPPQSLRETVDHILQSNYSQLLRCEDVMFFRPFGQSGFSVVGEEDAPPGDAPATTRPVALADAEPVVALLDGAPLEHHDLLIGRLIIDDPDNYQNRYAPSQQRHGTAMSSLIVHGDLSGGLAGLQRPVHVRPIFIPTLDFRNKTNEVTPDDELLVDLIHRSVRRLKEGDGKEGPTAPSVKIINLSIGNPFQPFDRDLSPLARLLDWLSWKHKVLFLVSAGNFSHDIRISVLAAQWRALTPDQLRNETLRAMRDVQIERRPLSPAEAVNVVTVGAVHADDATMLVPNRLIDLLGGARLPSPLGTVASGFKRAVKPEILFPGGRQLYYSGVSDDGDPACFVAVQTIQPPGQKVACPGQSPMELGKTMFTRGTSNATALATRCAAQIYEQLQELKALPGGDQLDEESLAVVIKALLVHGASWGSAADAIKTALTNAGTDWRETQRLQVRFLGYGEVDPQRTLVSTDQRATIIGFGKLAREKAHVFEVPLPPCLSASKEKRRLTVTLAWLSPINTRHRSYRQAQLWFHVNEDEIGVSKADLDSDTARRGTVEHRVFEGEKVRGFIENQQLSIKVSCKDGAGKCVEEVPYALAVTLEVAEGLDMPIYQEIAERIRPKVEVGINPAEPA